MEAAFWTGFFGAVMATVTAVAAHLKNQQQDAVASALARRTSALEAELASCHEDRRRLEALIVSLLELTHKDQDRQKPSDSSGETDSVAVKKPR